MNSEQLISLVRQALFGGSLSPSQVAGMEAILRAAPADMPMAHLAYALATAKHETAHTMQPIAEYGRGAGRPYGKPGKHGQAQYGRGYVQLTWDANYERADRELGLGGRLLKDFGLALDPAIAAAIMFRGMAEGWFTGKRLSDYFGPGKDDPVNARRIINGTDKASTIAGYHKAFLAALKVAFVAPLPAGFPASAPPARTPAEAAPKPATCPTCGQPLPRAA